MRTPPKVLSKADGEYRLLLPKGEKETVEVVITEAERIALMYELNRARMRAVLGLVWP